MIVITEAVAAVRYTQKEGSLYAMVLGPPRGGSARIRDLQVEEKSALSLLGHDGALDWRQESGAAAYALRITPAPV